MSMKANLSAAVIASAMLFAATSGQAAPVIYDNETDFNAAIGAMTLSVEDFEAYGDLPSGFDFGDFIMESAWDLEISTGHGTNGGKTYRISEIEDKYITFTFHAPIQAFRIDIIDARRGGFVEYDGPVFEARGVDRIEDVPKQIDVAIDQIEPAFVRLAAQPGGDADHVAIGHVLVSAGRDDLIGRARSAMQQVERLPLGRFFVEVQQGDLAHDATRL